MEFLFLLVAFAILALPIVALIASLGTRSELRELRSEVRRLERRLEEVRLDRARIEGAGLAAKPAEERSESREAAKEPPPVLHPPDRAEPSTSSPRTAAETFAAELEERSPKRPEETALPKIPVTPGSVEPSDGPGLERLLGIRGAAIAGGALLALTAILFFQHAFEQGWITPRARVVTGAIGGAVALVAAFALHRRGIRSTPGALAGAGLVAWYAATWASHRLYGFLTESGATPLFVLTTAVGVWASLRLASQATAVIGLIGGFATPLLLEVESPSAWSFFGYLVLLEAALLVVAARGRFGLLPLLAVLAASGVQGLWMTRYLGPDVVPVVLLALGVQALLFAFLAQDVEDEARTNPSTATAARYLALGAAVVAAHLFAVRADLAPHLGSQGLLAGVVLAGAFVLERRGRLQSLFVTGLGLAAIALPFFCGLEADASTLEPVAVALALGAPLLASLAAREWDRRAPESDVSTERAIAARAVFALAAVLLAYFVLVPRVERPVAYLAPAALLAVATWRERYDSLRFGVPLGPLLCGAGLGALFVLEARSGRPARLFSAELPALCWGLVALFAALAHRASLAVSGVRYGALALAGFAALASIAAATEPGRPVEDAASLLHATAFATVALGATAYARGRAAYWPIGAAVAVAMSIAVLPPLFDLRSTPDPSLLGTRRACVAVLYLLALGLGAFGGRLGATRRSSFALATLAFVLWEFSDGLASGGWLEPAGAWHAALGAALALLACLAPRPESHERWTAFGALAVLLFAFAFARLVGEPRWLLGAGPLVFGLAILDGRKGARGLLVASGYVAVLTTLLVVWYGAGRGFDLGVRRGLSPGVLGLVLTTLAAAFGRHAAPPSPEDPSRAIGRNTLGVCALVLAFASLTLFVLEVFGASERTRFELASGGGAQVALSVAWAAFALGLLWIGRSESRRALRYASLGVLCCALAKLFLVDLSHLEGLYRVGAIGGLALGLLAVSLIYQRFVFRVVPEDRPPNA